MFVAIYRWRLHPGQEQAFIDHWKRVTELGVAAGSGGSSLLRDQDGNWVAIARWPSREARTVFFQRLSAAGDAAYRQMRRDADAAIAERFADQELETAIDLWTPSCGRTHGVSHP